jgi:hypothetical protein
VEVSLATLRGAGFSPPEALEAHWLLVGYTLGHVSFQLATPLVDPDAGAAELHARRQALPSEDFPNVLECLPHAVGCDFGAAYAVGLDTIIAGLEARLASPG